MKEKLMCKVFNNDAKRDDGWKKKILPFVNPYKVTMKDGKVIEFESANEFKKWRKALKSRLQKARKEVSA